MSSMYGVLAYLLSAVSTKVRENALIDMDDTMVEALATGIYCSNKNARMDVDREWNRRTIIRLRDENKRLQSRLLNSENPDRFNMTDAEINVACNEGKIPAIKLYRERTGLGLKDSKDAIENEMSKRGLTFANPCVYPA